MNDFEKLIDPFPHVKRTYTSAMESAKAAGVNKESEFFDHFMSENCRAWFFNYHLKVEREGSDEELRDINKSPIVPFELSVNQLALLDLFEARMKAKKKFRQRVMKCRRSKISTICLAIGYHLVRFNENKKGLCFADRLETSRKLRRILDVFYQTDDLIDKPDLGKRTLCEGLYLHHTRHAKSDSSTDSFILLGSGEQGNTGIGGSLDFMHWSEAALTKDATTHWVTISPSLQGALFDIAESTPCLTGQDEVIYSAFEEKNKNCDLLFISWMDVPEYKITDPLQVRSFEPYVEHALYGKEIEIMMEYKPTPEQMLWRRFKLDELGSASSFRVVFPISLEEAFFSGLTLFFPRMLIEMTKPQDLLESKNYTFSEQGYDISMIPDDAGAWKMYERRRPDETYLISADSSEGKATDKQGMDPDYSVATVFKLGSPVIEVGIFRERGIFPDIFAEQCAAVAKHFNNALIVPERNNTGLAFIVRLKQIYSNIYKTQRLQEGTYIQSQDHGFQTTSTSKVNALCCLLAQMRDPDKGLILHTEEARKELSKFMQMGVKYQAMDGYHDDIVSCLWLMAVCINQTPGLLKRREFLTGQAGGSMRQFKPSMPRDSWATIP